jgi:hypothetical protein
MERLSIGPVKIEGLLGHALAVAGGRLWSAASSGKVWKWSLSLICAGLFALGAERGVRFWHEIGLKDPVVKGQYVVEDSLSSGTMEVRQGTDHLRLECTRHAWLDPARHEWNSNSSGCFDLAPGTEIKLEKWDDESFVYRTTGSIEVYAHDTGTEKAKKTVDVEDSYRKKSD